MIRRAAALLAFFAGVLLVAAPAYAVGPGVITGTVSPVAVAPEVEVCLVEGKPSGLCTAPDPTGAYRLTGVPIGGQRVEFIPSHRSGYLKQYYDHRSRLEDARVIRIEPPPGQEVKGIDAELEPGSIVEGIARAAGTGARLADVEACVEGAGTGTVLGCSSTGPSGTYAIGSLPAGVYKVGFWGQGTSARYAPRFFGGAEDFGAATAISVPAASTVTGIDAELEVGARIEGAVTAAATGARLPGIPVCLFAAGAVAPAACVFSEPAGTYSLLGIAAGSYQVGFALAAGEVGGDTAFGESSGYLPQYYDRAAVRAGARTLSLALGQVATGIDASLLAVSPLAPVAVPAPPAGPSSALVPVIPEPMKSKARKKCRRSGRGKVSKAHSKCVKKRHRKRNKRHRHHHRPRHGSSKHR
jgi:hypothetical protein